MYPIDSVESLQAYAGRLQRQSQEAALARAVRTSAGRTGLRNLVRRTRTAG